MDFLDNSKNHVCDSDNKTKVIKVYNCHNFQKCAKSLFKLIYMNLVGQIKLIGFSKK